MEILGIEVPDEVVEAIDRRAKTELLFEKFIKQMNFEFNFMQGDGGILHREVEIQKKSHPGSKYFFVRIKYDTDIGYEIGVYGTDNNGVTTIIVDRDFNGPLRKIHYELFDHMKKMYKIDFKDFYLTVHWKKPIIYIKCKTSQGINEFISDIEEKFSGVQVRCLNKKIIRIQILEKH